MKVLIAGGDGQVGRELSDTAPGKVEVVAMGHALLDITNGYALGETVDRLKPDVIINAAAYTAVDKAEQEKETAFAVNAKGAGHLAMIAKERQIRLLHISTDFVFDGRQSTPYLTDAVPNPLGVYGASKREGERMVQEILGSQALILRTAWVYSSFGNNFVKTMLKLMRERSSLNIVADQVGTPTWAKGLASAIWKMLELELTGLHHWTDAGVASWYDFAQAIQEEGLRRGILQRPVVLHPIPTALYPTPAARPSYSVLDKMETWRSLGYTSDHWRVALCNMLQRVGRHG
ncbi:MAG: dTDP-4-dehydrorhamnose reductase [Magnetococcales bacterium]|nr:dTDP-4-dehydrorhamnose reductase [Magnetococcales bacterium]